MFREGVKWGFLLSLEFLKGLKCSLIHMYVKNWNHFTNIIFWILILYQTLVFCDRPHSFYTTPSISSVGIGHQGIMEIPICHGVILNQFLSDFQLKKCCSSSNIIILILKIKWQNSDVDISIFFDIWESTKQVAGVEWPKLKWNMNGQKISHLEPKFN